MADTFDCMAPAIGVDFSMRTKSTGIIVGSNLSV